MRIRILPCDTCPEPAQLPDGSVYAIGRPPAGIELYPYRYKCSRCKRTTLINAEQWNRLPEVTLADLKAYGLAGMATKDLMGAGVTAEQIEQLEAAGVDFASLHPTPEERGLR